MYAGALSGLAQWRNLFARRDCSGRLSEYLPGKDRWWPFGRNGGARS